LSTILVNNLQFRDNSRVRGGVAFWFPEARAKDHPAKGEPRGLTDTSYRFSEMEITGEEGGTHELLSEEKLFLATAWAAILDTERQK
jgi:hypothetical protein